MSTITLRSTKGSPLTNNEVDANFTNINADKLEISNNLSDLASASTALTNLGLTATAAEINYTAGVTSAIQTQIDALQRPSIAVTVADSGSGNKFYLDGTEQQIARLIPSVTYKFDQSDSSNSGHPLLLSTTADGTHGGGSSYTVGVTAVGTPGTAGAYTEVKLEQDAPDTLYYYCVNHAGMGGEVTVRAGSITLVDLGVTASASELNTLSGITASTSELNTLTGITASTSELNTLTGVPATLTATELGYVDGVTSSIQTQIDSLGSSAGTTLTKTFTAGESYTMTLSDSVLVPVVSVTKEVTQSGVSNNEWDVNSSSENYTRYNSATAVTLTPSAVGDGTFTLGSGSFSSGDVGKTIVGNGGVAVLTATSGTYNSLTNFTNTNAIASGSWQMYGVVFNTTDGDLELSSFSDVYNFDAQTQLSNSTTYSGSSGFSGATHPMAIHWGEGSKTRMVTTVDMDSDSLMTWEATAANDLSSFNKQVDMSISSQMSSPTGFCWADSGNKAYICDSSNIYQYTISSTYEASGSYASKSLTGLANISGVLVSDDGTQLYACKSNGSGLYHYTMSTANDLSTAGVASGGHFSLPSQTGLDDWADMVYQDSGNKLYIIDTGKEMFEYNLSTAYRIETASFVRKFTLTAPSDIKGFDIRGNGSRFYAVGSAARLYEYSIGAGVVITSGYHAAHTTTSTDSTYWTDINSMTADEAAGSGNIYYCVSTDDRTTWKVAKGTDGERSIVRNNSGTWQYNSNGTYGSETWANATTNAELAAIQEAMGTAANQMNKTQLDAIPDANHFALANDLDLAIIFNLSSGSTVSSSDGVAINYDANVLNQGAILGTDYNYDAPAQDKVRITAVNGANLKVRVI